MKSKLDPESLGIILLGPFLLEFFPDQVGVGMCRGGFSHAQYDKYLPSDTDNKGLSNVCKVLLGKIQSFDGKNVPVVSNVYMFT